MKRILLVQPNYRHTEKTGVWMANVPLGLCYIASVIRNNGHFVKIIDSNALNLSPNEVAKEANKFDFVGIGGMTPAHGFISEFAKKVNDNVIKVVGGPHATGYSEYLLNNGYDIVVRGEGEYTFLDILSGKKYPDITGISYRKDRNIFHNPDRPFLNPDDLPLPARDLLPNNGVDLPYIGMGVESRPWSPILTSRGCPFNCYFCNKQVFGRCFRPRNPKKVAEEIEMLVNEYGVKEIDIFDDSFNVNIQRAEEILDLIIEKGLDIKLRFSNGIRADKINPSLLRKLKKAGCTYIAYGIESGNQEILDMLGKSIKIERIRKSVELTKKDRIKVTGFFVLGLIGDNVRTMKQTIEFAKKLDLDIAQFTIATPYPGTRFFDMVKENGRLNKSTWEEIYHSSGEMIYSYPDTSSKEIVELMYKRAFKKFYYRPSYFLKKMLSIKSFGEFRVLIRGFRAIVRIGT